MIPSLVAAVLIWAPPENFTQWSKVDGLLRTRNDVKLTVALTPQMATVLSKAALAPWAAAGRVEIAARIHGDPVLAQMAAHPAAPRPDDALERPADARRTIERRLMSGPAGFVPGLGALDPSLIGPLGASGARWVLTGAYEGSGTAWAASGTTVFVPAHAIPKDAVPAPLDLTSPGVTVFDESADSESKFLAAMIALPVGSRPSSGWSTVAEAVAASGEKHADAASVAAWPGWDGTVASAPTDPSAKAAWDAYGETAKALERYQNSGTADLKILEGATNLLRKAQEARFYKPAAADAAPGLSPELRARLVAVYKRLKATAPDSLYDSAVSTSPVAAADLPMSVRASGADNWVGFDNPANSSAKAPAGAADSAPWRLRGLRVEWNDDRVLFRIFPGKVDATGGLPRPIYDVYIDLNHVLGAGAIRLLDGRGTFAQARDAWEFALSVCGTDARFFRAGSGDPEEIGALKAEMDAAHGEIRVAVSREMLRGNPSRWGYIVLSLAEDPIRQHRSPAAALVGQDGAQTLGLIAPLEVQKLVLDHPGTPQRVPAARRETAPRP